MIYEKNSFDLNLKWHFPEGRKYVFTFIALFLSLIIIYGNSFHCQWQFDDFANIIQNEDVHLCKLFECFGKIITKF